MGAGDPSHLIVCAYTRDRPGRPESGEKVLDNAGNCYLRTKGALTPAGQCKHLKLLAVATPTSPTTAKKSI